MHAHRRCALFFYTLYRPFLCITIVMIALILLPLSASAADYTPLTFQETKIDITRPVSCVKDSNDYIYVCDAYYRQLTILDQNGSQANVIKDGLSMPIDVAVSDDYIYILDEDQDAVIVFSTSGTYVSTIGGLGLAPGQLDTPTDILLDNGELYIADSGNHRIQVFDATTFSLNRILGLEAGNVDLTSPAAIAINGDTLYIVHQRGTSVITVNKATGSTGSVSLSLSAQENVFITVFGNEVLLSNPANSAIDRYDLSLSLIASVTPPTRIYRIDFAPDGALMASGSTSRTADAFAYAYAADYTSYAVIPEPSDSGFNTPYAVSSDASGNLYIADYGNSRVQVYDESQTYQFSVNESISNPIDIAYHSGLVYVLNDDSTVAVLNTSGTLVNALDVSFITNPQKIDIIDSTRLVVMGSSALFFVTIDGTNISYTQKTHNYITSPRDITVYDDNVYFLASLDGNVLTYNADAVLIGAVTGASMKKHPDDAYSLGFAADGTLYIADYATAKLYRYESSFDYIACYDLTAYGVSGPFSLSQGKSDTYICFPAQNEIGVFSAARYSGGFQITINDDAISGFSATRYTYDFTMSSEQEVVDIDCAATGDYSADGAIGRYLLDYGLNEFNVYITNDDTVSTYTLYVTRNYPDGFVLDADTIDAFIAYQAASETAVTTPAKSNQQGAVMITLDLQNLDPDSFNVVSLSKHVKATIQGSQITLIFDDQLEESPSVLLSAKDGIITVNEKAMAGLIAKQRNLFIALASLAGAVAVFGMYFFTLYLKNHPGKRKYFKFQYKKKTP
jgi:sugar lactone lactonase YvrE